MPSTALQSRIAAFENLSHTPPRNIPRRIEKPGSLLEAPISPTAAHLPTIVPLTKSQSSPSPSTSLDLKDWVFDDGPSPPKTNGFIDKPVIKFEAAPPPLPPRKQSLKNLKGAAAKFSSPPLPTRHSDSLVVEHTYPPQQLDLSKGRNGHAPASSISSFHSVSLSSDPGTPSSSTFSNHLSALPVDQASTNGSEGSLDESYENVSASGVGSPTTTAIISQDWENAMAKRKPTPPKLPRRPSQSPVPPSPPLSHSSSSPPAGVRRKAPPPPPSRSSTSDRSSILSTTSQSTGRRPLSKTALSRPTPVPLAAQKRYESLFNANVLQQRKAEKLKPPLLSPNAAKKTRQAAGWRGLSIDLTTTDELSSMPSEDDWVADGDELVVGAGECLDAHVVRHIWSRSRLDKDKLRDIWQECDTGQKGSMDLEGFVKGMWRIDEELRRAQLRSSVSSFSSMRRQIPIPKPKPKAILR